MELAFVKMDSFCTGAGRASQLGCYVQYLGPQAARFSTTGAMSVVVVVHSAIVVLLVVAVVFVVVVVVVVVVVCCCVCCHCWL